MYISGTMGINPETKELGKDFYVIIYHKKICLKIVSLNEIHFPHQSLKIFTFRVKLSDLIFFLLGHSPIVKLI